MDNIDKKALAELSLDFGVGTNELRLIHQNDRNSVYDYRLNNKEFILKIIRASRSDINLISGELDWIDYLYNNGIRVLRTIPSRRDKLIETIELDGSFFLGFSYEKIGVSESMMECEFVQKLGQVMGRMHKVTKDYEPSDKLFRRPEWFHADWLSCPDKVIHTSQPVIIEKCHEFRERLQALEFNRDSYGLIHDDLHTGNLIISNGEITIIDFECCQYKWFIGDIASALLFNIWKEPNKDMELMKQSAIDFMENLMIGYNSENKIAACWGEHIPLLLKLREMSLYVSCYSEWDLGKINKDQSLFLYRKHNIENDVPYIDIDFSESLLCKT
jgi:amicoumacin kinase